MYVEIVILCEELKHTEYTAQSRSSGGGRLTATAADVNLVLTLILLLAVLFVADRFR